MGVGWWEGKGECGGGKRKGRGDEGRMTEGRKEEEELTSKLEEESGKRKGGGRREDVRASE
jgi:hypothetical protein